MKRWLLRGLVATTLLVFACNDSDSVPVDGGLSDSEPTSFLDASPDATTLPESTQGQVGGWVRDDHGDAWLSGFVCGEGTPQLVVRQGLTTVTSTAVFAQDATWLSWVAPSVSPTCRDTLRAFSLEIADAQPGPLEVIALTLSGDAPLAPGFRSPVFPPHPLAGWALVNHDAFSHSTRPHNVPPQSERSPGAATSPVDQTISLTESLFIAEHDATQVQGGALVLSLMYGQTPLFETSASPWLDHRSYWEDRGCVGACTRDNLGRLMDVGRDLWTVYDELASGPRIVSIRLNDYHHVIAPAATPTTTRHAIANPPFLETHYDDECHTLLTDPETRTWKQEQLRDLVAAANASSNKLDALELDLTRGFCFGVGSATAMATIVSDTSALLDEFGAALILRVPRDVPRTEVEASIGTLDSLVAMGVDGFILGRIVGARNDSIHDEVSMLTGVAETGPFWQDSFQYDRALSTSAGTLNLPATFERLTTDVASTYNRGGTGASLFNFQYYSQHFARPVGAAFERVPPPYAWLDCLRRPACVANLGRHYAGRLDDQDRVLIDSAAPSAGVESAWVVAHPRQDLSAASRAELAAATIEAVNLRSDEVAVLEQGAPAYPFADSLGLGAGVFGQALFDAPNVRSASIAAPSNGLSRYLVRCMPAAACRHVSSLELFATSAPYPF